MYDLIIRNGRLVDGTGARARVADVAVKDGLIAEIGEITGEAAREIDAGGLLITPGWVDIHTHYDWQALWDPLLEPSFSTGVTTAIMGNCGVGLAPVHPEHRQLLVELFDGVEEIPAATIEAALDWRWTSFPEYLDTLEPMERAFDVGVMVPHGPLRLFVMGEEAADRKCGTPRELTEMSRLLEEALEAGAFGISCSRTRNHRTSTGAMTFDYEVEADELLCLARSISRHGGYMEFVPRGGGGPDEYQDGLKRDLSIYERIARETGIKLHVIMVQSDKHPEFWREEFTWANRVNAEGSRRVIAQVSGRPAGYMMSFFGTHPFMDKPTFKEVKKLHRDEWLAKLAEPEVRHAILTEENPADALFAESVWHTAFDLGDPMDWEPAPEKAILALAENAGKTPDEYAYDRMLTTSYSPRVFLASVNYKAGNLDVLKEMIEDPASVVSLSDGGAHAFSICDGAIYTFLLTHWGRDRTRGPLIPVEKIIHEMTLNAASSIGLADRGVLKPGLRADINIIDFHGLSLEPARVAHDLPGGGSRLLQKVKGYRATIVGGVVTREHDEATGALPGRLLRHKGGAIAGAPERSMVPAREGAKR